ncbi:MAG: hypothetical protein H0Z28_02395 [Archaeoglobus sp.]|nr:hypothetical protein [Archaeoglobus sp.]
MLEYKLTNVDLAISTLSDPILLAVTIFVYIVLGICFLKVKLKKARSVILLFLILLPILYLFPIFVKAGWDWYGYEYDDKLHIKP